MTTQDEREDRMEIPNRISMTLRSTGESKGFSYKTAEEVPSTIVITAMADIDELVDMFQDEIRHLSEIRQGLMNRAISGNLKEDRGAMLIEKPGKLMRNSISDIPRFAIEFPNEYAMIRDQQKRDVVMECNKYIDHVDDAVIPLMLADRMVGKDRVSRFVGTKPQTIEYKVMRKHNRGKLHE